MALRNLISSSRGTGLLSKLAVLLLAVCGVAGAQSTVIFPTKVGSSVALPTPGGSTVIGSDLAAPLPTMGSTATGASTNNFSQFFIDGDVFVAPGTGTYTTFHVYCEAASGTGGGSIGVYSASGGNPSGKTLIAQASFVCPVAVFGWVTGSISIPVVAGQSYYIAAAAASSSTYNVGANTTGGSEFFVSTTNGTLTTPLPTATSGPKLDSFYLSNP